MQRLIEVRGNRLLATGVAPRRRHRPLPSCAIGASCCAIAVLTRMRAAVKHRVHELLARQRVQPNTAAFLGRPGREFLASLERPEATAGAWTGLMSVIGGFGRKIPPPPTRSTRARATTRVCPSSARSRHRTLRRDAGDELDMHVRRYADHVDGM